LEVAVADVLAELTARYTQWMSAAQRKDLPTLETILAPEFAYTDNKIGRQTRADWFATLAVYDVDRFSFQSIEVMPYGDTVVAIVVYEQTGRRYGEPRSGTFFITDVWHRAHGGWQVVARSSMLAQPA
jgi:ketosteroid isomerase-like protein